MKTQNEFEAKLSQWGLPTLVVAANANKLNPEKARLSRVVQGIEEACQYYREIHELRHQIPFDIDGVVIKVNSFLLQEELGFIARSPRWATAAKFAPEQAYTTIESIKIQVGRTGALTPVAVMQPVQVGGVTITHATLHNQDEIDRKDVRVGDRVLVQRAGDVIPDIVSVDLKNRPKNSKPFKIPRLCPVCDSRAEQPEGEVVLRCVNPICPAVIKGSLKHFVSRRAINIDKLGEKQIEQFVDMGLIRSFSDIYKLTAEQIQTLERQGKKSSENIIAAIAASKKVSLARFIYALGIRFVGEQTAKTLARSFGSVENFLKASYEELIELDDVGPKVAESIIQALAQKEFVTEIKALLDCGLRPTTGELQTGDQLKGKKIVITGTFAEKREDIKTKIESLGGAVSSSVSKNTSFVLAGDEPGSKLEKAKKAGVPVLDWDQFIKLLN